VLVPYERLDDGKPAALVIDRLMRRLRCSAREAFDLGEALLALDADATVIAQYVTRRDAAASPRRAGGLGCPARHRRARFRTQTPSTTPSRSVTTSTASPMRASLGRSPFTYPTPTRRRRPNRRVWPGACSGPSTRRGSAARAAVRATRSLTTQPICRPVRAAGRPTRGRRVSRPRSGRSSPRSKPAPRAPSSRCLAGGSTPRSCPAVRPASPGRGTGSRSVRKLRPRSGCAVVVPSTYSVRFVTVDFRVVCRPYWAGTGTQGSGQLGT
jgi:hypothetical protein